MTVKLDTTQEIENWFLKAKPTPTLKDLSTQVGCLLEEVHELLVALNGTEGVPEMVQTRIDALQDLANLYKSKDNTVVKGVKSLTYQDHIDIVDACCDTNVTSVGVMTLLGGVDVLGAMKEVINSNNSKMVNGEFVFNEQGKIAKPESFVEPDLTKYVI